MNKGEEIPIHNENDNEIDEELLRIYQKNMTKIINISKWIKIFKTTSIISLLCFLIILAIKLSVNFSWFYLLIPSLISTLSFTLYLNNYLRLKDIFDEECGNSDDNFDCDINIDKHRAEDNSSHLGSIISYSCVNLAAICLVIYLILIASKLEKLSLAGFNEIGIPAYLMLGIFIFYAIFILPAFIANGLIGEIILIFVNLIGSTIFLVLLNLKLDKRIDISYLSVFYPLIFSLMIYISYSIFYFLKSSYTANSNKIGELFFVLSIFTATVLISLKFDGHLRVNNWVVVIIVIFGCLCYVVDNLWSGNEKKEEETAMPNSE